MDFGFIQQALGKTGSSFELPTDAAEKFGMPAGATQPIVSPAVEGTASAPPPAPTAQYTPGHPYAGNPAHVASPRDPYPKAYEGNPTTYSDANSRARANGTSGNSPGAPAPSPAPAQPTPPSDIKTTAQTDGQEALKLSRANNAEAKKPVEYTGEQKRNLWKNKVGSAIGAVANFYGGNWAGAASSAKGFFDTSEETANDSNAGMKNIASSAMKMFGG